MSPFYPSFSHTFRKQLLLPDPCVYSQGLYQITSTLRGICKCVHARVHTCAHTLTHTRTFDTKGSISYTLSLLSSLYYSKMFSDLSKDTFFSLARHFTTADTNAYTHLLTLSKIFHGILISG